MRFVDREQNEAELFEGLRYGRLTAIFSRQLHLRWCQDRREVPGMLRLRGDEVSDLVGEGFLCCFGHEHFGYAGGWRID